MNLKKSFSKKWYEWYEGSEYQQVIHRFVSENGTRMVRLWWLWYYGYVVIVLWKVSYGEGVREGT